MRLYRTKAGQWAGTQAGAGKGHTLYEVPTSKPELLAFLNQHCAPSMLAPASIHAPPSNLDLTALGGGVAGVRARALLEAAIGVETAFLCDDHIAQAEARAELRAAIAKIEA